MIDLPSHVANVYCIFIGLDSQVDKMESYVVKCYEILSVSSLLAFPYANNYLTILSNKYLFTTNV